MIQNPIFGVYLLNSDFLAESLKPTKTCRKDDLFYNTVTLKKSYLFYQPQLTQHGKKRSRNTAKNLLTLQIFQQTCFWLVSEKKSAKNCILFLESKCCLYIPVYLGKKTFVPETQETFTWWGPTVWAL